MATKEMLKNSIEAKWFRRNMVMFGGILGIYVIVMLCLLLKEEALREVWIIWFPGLGLFGGLLYEAVQYWMMFLHRDRYEIYEVMLDRPGSTLLILGYVHFTIEIATKSGMRIFRKTKPLWCENSTSQFKAWEYVNSEVSIAYDEKRDRLVVLGTKADWGKVDG